MIRCVWRSGVVAVALAALLVGGVPAWAQPGDPAPLMPGEPVSGQLASGASVTYRAELPAGQDAVVTVEASRVVALRQICVQAAEDGEPACYNRGGGGGDGPISTLDFIPARDGAGEGQAIELTLGRPASMLGTSRYTVTLYAVAPAELALDEPLSVTPDAGEPYQVYTLAADPDQPFTVEIEDAAAEGAFLWVAHQPYQSGFITPADEPLLEADRLDSAARADNPGGIAYLGLYYLGGRTFRVLVGAEGPYDLHPAAVDVQPLAAGEPLEVTASYRAPVQVVRLLADEGEAATIRAEVVEGVGALVRAYTADHPFGTGPALGVGANGAELPLSGTIADAVSPGALFVAVQVPFEFTRDEVRVTLEWTR